MIWVGSTVVRVWQRRELSVTQAVRTGVHKPARWSSSLRMSVVVRDAFAAGKP
jgi:hypothetical protein